MIPVSRNPASLAAGGVWRMSAAVVDFDGAAVTALPTVTITLPDNTTLSPVPELVAAGGFVVDYIPVAAGRYLAHWATGYGAADFSAYVTAPTAAQDMPDLDAAKTYLGIDLADTSRDAEVQDALDAEADAQRAVCVVGALYPRDLRQALLRRVSRNLALRLLPLAVLRGDAEAGGTDTVLPGKDPEIRRLEGPYRRVVIG